MPALTTIVAPVALMIGVIYTFNLLNDGSELVVINATGARQWSLLKPVLLIATGVAIFMASMTLYFSPLSMRLWRELVTDVRGSVVSSLLKEGEFIKLAPGLTFQLRQRMPDGTLHGIFMSDTRDTDETSTYLAERGAVLDNALGVFLVMADGTIQQRKKSDGSISFIQFSQYAYDLSSFSSTSAAPRLRPAERPTSYLLDPDPDDRFFQQHPEKYMSELHSRLTTPLNAFVFAILPLVFLSQAESTRQRRGATIGLAVGSAVTLAVIEFVLNGAAETSLLALIGLYLVPIAAVSICVLLILAGISRDRPNNCLFSATGLRQARAIS